MYNVIINPYQYMALIFTINQAKRQIDAAHQKNKSLSKSVDGNTTKMWAQNLATNDKRKAK